MADEPREYCCHAHGCGSRETKYVLVPRLSLLHSSVLKITPISVAIVVCKNLGILSPIVYVKLVEAIQIISTYSLLTCKPLIL